MRRSGLGSTTRTAPSERAGPPLETAGRRNSPHVANLKTVFHFTRSSSPKFDTVATLLSSNRWVGGLQMRRYTLTVLSFLFAFFGIVHAAQATVRVSIDTDTQTMTATSDDGSTYTWPVSTGRSGFATPRGTYGVQRMMAVAHSNLYNNAPMPHSIFFSGAYAIHGTYATGMLGRPASHGCIRLAPGAAAKLFSMVRSEGAVISITGSAPRVYTASRLHRAKGVQTAGRYKPHKYVRVAKSGHHRSTGAGYLAYAPPQGGDAPLETWLTYPDASY